MVRPKCLATGCPLLLLVLVAALANSQSAGEFKNVPVQTTGSPAVIQTANATAKSSTGKPAIELTAPAASKVDIKAPAANTVAPHPASTGPAKATTAKPDVINIKAATNTPNPVAPVSAATKAPARIAASAAAAASANQAPDIKMAQYFEPICKHLNQLTGEHMFKVQSQMKLFVEKTAGKMSVCFMQHYMIDPNLSPVDKTQLKKICSSQTLAADAKSSFENFQSCARNNWDKNLDVELDRIIKLRENCFFNHGHSKNDSTISLLHDEEISLIGEVVGKVLRDNNQAVNGKPNITLINLGPTPASAAAAATTTTTSAASGAGGAAANGAANKMATPPASNQSAASKIMNDPNTLLVLVDDAPTTRTLAHSPAPVSVNASAAHPPPSAAPKAPAAPAPATKPPVTMAAPATTQKPAAEVKLTIAGPPTATAKPTVTVLGEKIISAATTSAPKPPTTTADPKLANATYFTVVVGSTEEPAVKSVASTAKPAATTMKPAAAAESITTARNPSTKDPITTKKPETPTTKASSATSSKPQTTSKTAASTTVPTPTTKQPAAAKGEQESNSKEQDQNKAKDAIKSLQKQRAGHVSDARMHQIEHERQMTIDPVGHTIKHKKYEEMKQRRTSTVGPASSESTTKKP